MDMSKVQRALGVIQGVCVGLADKPAEIIGCAVCEIDCELETRNPGMNTPISLNGVQFEESDCLSSRDMEALRDRLKNHFVDYQNGKCQHFDVVCRDCLMAALAITQLGEVLTDKDCTGLMEQP